MGLFDISSSHNDQFYWSDRPPATDKIILLNKANIITLYGGWGVMAFQQVITDDFDIWLSNYHIDQRRTFFTRADVPVIEFTFQLEHDAVYTLTPLNELKPKLSQFNLFYLPYIENKVILERGTNIVTLDIHLHDSFLNYLAIYFPHIILEFQESIEKKQPAQLFKEPMYATQVMLGLVKDIIGLLAKDPINKPLINLKVKQLLTHALSFKNEIRYQGRIITPWELNQVHGANLSLQNNLFKTPTIKELSRLTGMNEHSLNGIYKRRFSITPYQDWLQLRMHEAFRRVTTTNERFKEIALDLGFSNLANFSKAFRKFFHHSPKYFRK